MILSVIISPTFRYLKPVIIKWYIVVTGRCGVVPEFALVGPRRSSRGVGMSRPTASPVVADRHRIQAPARGRARTPLSSAA